MSDFRSPNGSLHILLYADTDLNLIDGSSVWTTSVARLLASLPGAHLTLLLKRPLKRSVLVADLPPNVRLVDPWTDDSALDLPEGRWQRSRRLSPNEAVLALRSLDRHHAFDLILLRGFDVCRRALEDDALAGPVWEYFTGVSEKDADTLRFVHSRAAKILCQTPRLQRQLMAMLGVGEDKFLLLPPMIPDLSETPPSFVRRTRRLVYVGKMAPLYHTQEMLELFPTLRERFPGAEFHLAGDKFHNDPPSRDFPGRMRHLLEDTTGVIWHKALSREDTQKLIATCDVSCSWRHAAMSDSLEISTKFLEYAGHGKPVLLNRTPMHEELLGPDYPFFCDTPDEFLAAATRALTDDEAYSSAARELWEVAGGFTLSSARDRLVPHIPRPRPAAPSPPVAAPSSADPTPLRVMIAGHDLRFIDKLTQHLQRAPGFEVRLDKWISHREHDESATRDLMDWADVIVGEWCLANAVWLSDHLPPHKGLIIRIHRVEFNTDYPDQLNTAAIHRIVTIAPHSADKVRARLPQLAPRVVHIPQPIDCKSFERRGLVGSDFRLGLLGWVPALKRPDLALDIFNSLRRRDRRYQLFLKGRFPTELQWVWRRDDERQYYRDLMARINHSPWRDSVSFEPFGDDVNVWFQKVGFILSTSDVEGCHVSVSEGMASGAVPIIRSWEGAAHVYPPQYVIDTVQDAVDLIEEIRREPEGVAGRAEEIKRYAYEQFDLPHITAQWEQIIAEVAEEARSGDTPAGQACSGSAPS